MSSAVKRVGRLELHTISIIINDNNTNTLGLYHVKYSQWRTTPTAAEWCENGAKMGTDHGLHWQPRREFSKMAQIAELIRIGKKARGAIVAALEGMQQYFGRPTKAGTVRHEEAPC